MNGKHFLILEDGKGGKAYLTTRSPLSHSGIPVLSVQAEDIEGEFGPADLINAGPGKMFPAANLVVRWTQEQGRTDEEKEAAR